MLKWILIASVGLTVGLAARAETTDAETDQYLEEILNFDYADLVGTLPETNYSPMSVRTLATRNVGPDLQTYTAPVADCARGLTHVRLNVSRAGLRVQGGGAIFSDGSRKTSSLSKTFTAPYTSPWISISYLGANGRCVTSVFVNAKSTDANADSRVVIEGKYP